MTLDYLTRRMICLKHVFNQSDTDCSVLFSQIIKILHPSLDLMDTGNNYLTEVLYKFLSETYTEKSEIQLSAFLLNQNIF